MHCNNWQCTGSNGSYSAVPVQCSRFCALFPTLMWVGTKFIMSLTLLKKTKHNRFKWETEMWPHVIRLNFWKNMDKKDFGDQVTSLQSKILENSTNLKFNLKRALTWAKFEKRRIDNKIRQRSATLWIEQTEIPIRTRRKLKLGEILRRRASGSLPAPFGVKADKLTHEFDRTPSMKTTNVNHSEGLGCHRGQLQHNKHTHKKPAVKNPNFYDNKKIHKLQ